MIIITLLDIAIVAIVALVILHQLVKSLRTSRQLPRDQRGHFWRAFTYGVHRSVYLRYNLDNRAVMALSWLLTVLIAGGLWYISLEMTAVYAVLAMAIPVLLKACVDEPEWGFGEKLHVDLMLRLNSLR